MKPRIVFIHGNQTMHWASSWTPWFRAELEKYEYPTYFETFPDSILARAQYWLPFLHDYVKTGGSDVLVGWSSGAVAAMRYAEANKIHGSVLISPSYTDLNDPLEKQSGYFDTPWDWKSIKKNQGNIALFYGDNDPFIPQNEFVFIAEKLKPDVIKIPGAKHFIERDTFPKILEYIVKKF